MSRKSWLVGLLLLALGTCVRAQRCDLRVSGTMLDEHGREELAFASVYAVETGEGVQADADGNFVLPGRCPGPLTLRFSHIGCDPKVITLNLQRDTSFAVYLHHHDNYTETVTVSATGAGVDYEERLDRQADRQLGLVLERITGVSSLRTGTAANKPVFEGLYGNRLSIQNNGVPQAGQQWGNDHAPEIDPWVAAYVRVVEGVDALRYGGSTLGPTVLIEPAPLTERTTPGGKVAYGLRSNGWGHTLNARLTDTAYVAYRISASAKASGDRRAPDYYLTNTGQREGNVAVQAAKFLNPRWTARAYYSLFNASIGVLRGSHVGNLSDLEEAIGRPRPFYTDPGFSYDFGSPRQRVSHHLLKGELTFTPSPGNTYSLLYGGQLDDRQEFDVRRGGDDDRAALKLRQYSHLLEGQHQRKLGDQRSLEAGVQLENVDNTNQPGTGILPLIPDYLANRVGGYVTYHYKPEVFRYHFGARFDHQYYEALTISRDLPRRVIRYRHHYNTVGASAGASLRVNRRLGGETELTYRQRAPQINELYSQGLHQGVSGIEEGDSSLLPERSLKASLELNYGSRDGTLSLSGGVFYQRVANFINLEPEQEFRLTVRGAFPVFTYRGVDAELYGGQLTALAQLGDLDIESGVAVVRGYNREDDLPLVYMPPTNWRTALAYALPADLLLTASALVVARQSRLEAEQDILPPPPGYALFGLGLARTLSLGGNDLNLELEVDNLLDQAYRDYLDRQRYFADAPGRSINFRLSYSW
ncbi:iron complex outermembrane receptor protein [Lewinella marina]|uniref:TonB-dependent receptor n=1 Tax=Neolewinella marina TaxID=438751 RepID=UPI00117AD44A|nr:TonB-dependent receptor [Neolewinella marina]NJB84856.1 iron complex outermembrane receptor protein [Neolewinella marina]